jgi:hypothetical protein
VIWLAAIAVLIALGVLMALSLAVAARRGDEQMKRMWEDDEPLRRHGGGWRL